MMKFAVHPGEVVSAHDGQRHYISAGELVRLYELRGDEYVVWREPNSRGLNWGDFLHLYPSPSGRYGRPEDP